MFVGVCVSGCANMNVCVTLCKSFCVCGGGVCLCMFSFQQSRDRVMEKYVEFCCPKFLCPGKIIMG